MVELKKKKATKIFEENGFKVVRLYQTDIVKFNNSEIILNTGGWVTQVTVDRMNLASREFNLGFRVSRKKGKAIVTYNGEDTIFEREVILKR